MKFDCIIVGAGSIGMAAAYFLAKAGKTVCCIDAYEPPHINGSHHGETRIIRYAYGEGEAYVPLALRAAHLWEELAAQVDEELFLQTGVINVGDHNNPFIQTVIESARKYELPLEVLSSEEVMERWPGISLPDNMIAAFEPTSGILKVEKCVEAYKTRAIELGASFYFNEPVRQIITGDSVTVITDTHTFTAEQCVISSGAWTKQLLESIDVPLPLSPIRKTFAWYEADEQLYGDLAFPAFAFELRDACYYGFPSIDGAGYKIGRHDGGEPINPDEVLDSFNEKDAGDLDNFIDDYMPHVGPLKEGRVCKYTMTPDEHFIIDRLSSSANIIVASGFSGHGFKFASVIGEIISQMICGDECQYDIDLFKLSRFKEVSLGV
ncbi:N-methyl-L-tryptophan oxidase [Lysinibacillus odysseyi]|uniref:Methyltryptophan oxidase n=1 Tax=Lysinibacillus odysseyi 34hs-1 = NBRC 100172 TaxID=1220589 RepID=A0A0A3IAA3_9BACI|nr:N-methyl-L-tryptophan oxidase [Lysinibacillus odysseyi]KGR81701.1 methyltryptophan oxidase [Lysinibacillus odysseyi 34hs-1 = NBRC 100172]